MKRIACPRPSLISFVGILLLGCQTQDHAAWPPTPDQEGTSNQQSGGSIGMAAGTSVSVPSSASDSARTNGQAKRADSLFYDRTGAAGGRIDSQGNFYDKNGAAAGRVDAQGNYYDKSGAAAGRADAQGQFYDATGRASGRVDPNGSVYDATGAAHGRVDADGAIYDASGALVGRVEGPCTGDCARDAAKRLLER